MPEVETEESIEPIKSLKLQYPLSFKNGDSVKIIDFLRRPQARDLRGIDLQNLKMEEQCKILANITNCSTPQLMRCDMVDMNKLGEILTDFLEGGQETTKTR